MIAALAALLAQFVFPLSGTDSAARQPAIVARAVLDTTAPVNFRVLVLPETVYVGQQATYQLGVFLDASVQDRVRRLEAIAPEMRGMMAYDPPAPVAGFPARVLGARRYVAHVYQRSIFPLTAGRFAIPPAHLEYALPLSYSFFSREESYELRSDSAVIVALEPPRATRPVDWTGAVGSLRMDAHLDTTATRVGDPVLLTVRIAGRGNIKLLPRPRMHVPWASAVAADERVSLSTDSLDVRGAKEFDWVLTPQRAGRMVLPALRYPYFDPAARRYEAASTPTLWLDVEPGSLASTDTGIARPRWQLRTVYRGALAREPYETRLFWLGLLAAPLPAAALLAARLPRRRRKPPSPARTLRALAGGGSDSTPTLVRRAFLAALAARLGASATTLAEPRALARAARRAGATPSAADAAAGLLEELNAAAFDGRAASGGAELARRAERAYGAIDAEARVLPIASSRLVIALAIAVFGAGAAWAAPESPDAVQFARGVEAYERGHFAIAERNFAAVAERVPRAADAWANLGTAAFAARDTARAVWGWQHALRLEPPAADVRQRLELLEMPGGMGAVPPIAPSTVALAAAALWVAGWLVIALRARTRIPGDSRLAVAALVGACVLGAGSVALDERLAARDLAVVAQDTSMHDLPALGADTRASVRGGEMARIMERKGPWAHISVAGGRDGWVPLAALYSVARD